MNAKNRVVKALTSVHRAVFNASGGKVAGSALGMPVLVLTTTGRKSGQQRDTMLTSPLIEGDKIMLVASAGGDDREPAWCLNIRAQPAVEIKLGNRKQAMAAHIADPVERAELWPKITSAHPNYAGYQKRTDREIPVVICRPAN